MNPSARAAAGPRPLGLQATDRVERRGRSIAPDGPGDGAPDQAQADDREAQRPGGSSRPSRRCCRPATRCAPESPRRVARWRRAPIRRSPELGRSGLVRGVEPTGDQAPVGVAPVLVEVRPAARTAALFGEERIERRRSVDLPPAGAARKSGHTRIVRRVAPSGVADSGAGSQRKIEERQVARRPAAGLALEEDQPVGGPAQVEVPAAATSRPATSATGGTPSLRARVRCGRTGRSSCGQPCSARDRPTRPGQLVERLQAAGQAQPQDPWPAVLGKAPAPASLELEARDPFGRSRQPTTSVVFFSRSL
jgi:hypothetical protein